MNSRAYRISEAAWAGLLLWSVGTLTAPPSVESVDQEPSPQRMSADAAWSFLAGFRELAAGLRWIEVYGDWRRRDESELERGLEWVTRLDPAALGYWLNGARMLAYDVTAWRMSRPEQRVGADGIRQQQLATALAWLDRAANQHPDRAAIPIERAVLHWTVGRDLHAAEMALAEAQRCADAPYFVARVRAEFLVRQGREREALAVLEQTRRHLPEDDPAALVGVVDQRIAALRQRVGVPSP